MKAAWHRDQGKDSPTEGGHKEAARRNEVAAHDLEGGPAVARDRGESLLAAAGPGDRTQDPDEAAAAEAPDPRLRLRGLLPAGGRGRRGLLRLSAPGRGPNGPAGGGRVGEGPGGGAADGRGAGDGPLDGPDDVVAEGDLRGGEPGADPGPREGALRVGVLRPARHRGPGADDCGRRAHAD